MEEDKQKIIQAPPKPPQPETPPAPIRFSLKSLRTYQGDIEETLSRTKGSVTSILTAEKKRDESKGGNLSSLARVPNSDAKNKFLILVGGLLFILGAITMASVFYFNSQNTTNIATNEQNIITYTKETPILIASSTRKDLISSILTEKKGLTLPVNSVLYLKMMQDATTTANVEDVLNMLFPRIPQELVRAFDTKYMLGIFSFDTNEPFIILTTSDFGATYAGMLKWESGMVLDTSSLFTIPANVSTTTNVFEDEAYKNKDLRIVKDSNRKTVLVYSFLDKNTLVITANESIFNAILSKYITNQIVR
ncbi:MAG: hypothetical protein WCK48_02445 [bacterium]